MTNGPETTATPEPAASAPASPVPEPASSLAPSTAASAPAPVSPAAPTEPPTRYQGRIGGLDIARALAIFGMFYAHVAPYHAEAPGIRGILLAIPDGRSSILFALLAGVSLSILTGRNAPYTGEQMRTTRLRIFARAATLLVIAGVLSVLGTPIAIILAFYAAWFVAALPFTRLPAKPLLIIAATWAIIGPTLLPLITWTMENLYLWASGDSNGFVIDTFLTGTYPGLTYMAYVIAGMGIGRLDITARRVQGWLFAAGCALALVGYGASALLTNALVPPAEDWAESSSYQYEDAYGNLVSMEDGEWVSSDFSGDDEWTEPSPFQWQGTPLPSADAWVVAQPHTNTPFEAIGSGGFGIAVMALCLLGGALARNVLYPVAAAGSMSLSAYSLHIVIVAFHTDWVGGARWTPLLGLIGLTLLCATAWKHFSTRGPLEWIMWKVSLKAAS